MIRIDVAGLRPGKDVLVAALRKLGIKKSERCDEVFDLTSFKDVDVEARQRIVELLWAGRRLDARNAIEHVYSIDRRKTHARIEELVQEHILMRSGY